MSNNETTSSLISKVTYEQRGGWKAARFDYFRYSTIYFNSALKKSRKKGM